MESNTVTLEEMEQVAAVKEEAPAPKPKASETKLDFEDLPDALRGRTAADLASELERMQKALRMSEDARLALSRSAEAGERAPVTREAPEAQPLTREQLKELIAEDPLAAYDYMQNNMIAALDDHLNKRFTPLVSGTINTMESQAKQKYSAEFELFGDQIEAAKKQVDPRILSTAQGWDDMIAYIRGLPSNFEALVEHRTRPKAEEARERQRQDVGYAASRSSAPARTASPGAGGASDLDETQKEIARELYMGAKDVNGRTITTPEQAYAEYKRWQ